MKRRRKMKLKRKREKEGKSDGTTRKGKVGPSFTVIGDDLEYKRRCTEYSTEYSMYMYM